ncbi:hypothetical protein GCM10010172_12990 [Paractinoplanes ferrugineus]|uniref:Protein-glutamine gamma-glutamyltransferase-like C-terminal domain-containing protein n=2 Tax=Paractinoplanes ferrugineus TaxID=113564 RepID=A0A919IZZ0_9ACTN|nr:hypothetical protein Afe05nite_17040 [Actinoplanes ferrugineus]
MAAVFVLLFVTALAATRSSPQLDQIQPDATPTPPPLLPPTRSGGSRPPEAPPEAARGLPEWVGTVALVILGIILVVVLVLVAWAVLRDAAKRRARKGKRGRRTGQEGVRTAEELVAALDAGLEELSDTDRDPRRAVIACWVRLEQAAAAAGTPRNPGDSPTDLVGRLLREQRVDAQVLAALLEVYREARYATHAVDNTMRQQAISALERLRADLGAGVPG